MSNIAERFKGLKRVLKNERLTAKAVSNGVTYEFWENQEHFELVGSGNRTSQVFLSGKKYKSFAEMVDSEWDKYLRLPLPENRTKTPEFQEYLDIKNRLLDPSRLTQTF